MSDGVDRIEPPARARIADRIDRLAAEHVVTVLYACESGSRAWGVPSTNSDYDVRVVYTHPRDWYLSIDLERRDDTIDPPSTEGVDIHGWDLRKALGLFRAANPTLLEWLRSPIVYREAGTVLDRWRARIPDYYTPRAAGHAYRGMAQSVAEQNLTGDAIPHKAYLYVLRALLAVRWVEQAHDTPPPVPFEPLVRTTVERTDVRSAIDALVARKRAGTEADAGPRLPVLHDFIEAELERQSALPFPDGPPPPGPGPLNDIFRRVLNRDDGGG
jgi:predicted nucleotidyltransferase